MCRFETYDITAGQRHCLTGSLKIAYEFVAAIAKERGAAHLASVERCHSPVRDFPTSREPELKLTGAMDGFALTFGGDEVFIYPDYDGASDSFKAAKVGQRLLAACLAVATSGGSA